MSPNQYSPHLTFIVKSNRHQRKNIYKSFI